MSKTEKILDDEFAERQFAKMEMQINKTENTLKGMTQPQREWFQSMKQRRDEKERLSVNETIAAGNSKQLPKHKRKGDAHEFSKRNIKKRKEEKRTPEQLAKARAVREIEKVSLVRAKLAKSQSRPGRLNAMEEDKRPEKQQTNKKRSKFLTDLTDTSQRGAKRLRYQATKHKTTAKIQAKKHTSSVKITNKSGQNKFNKGKNFGGPRKNAGGPGGKSGGSGGGKGGAGGKGGGGGKSGGGGGGRGRK